LNVSEIFRSIQGESSYAGLPCVFIRLAGCNLRCRYCDTRYAQEAGNAMSLDEIIQQVTNFGVDLVELTGGEPLFQQETPDLITALLKRGHMDIKCPSSGENHRVMWENVWKLSADDEVKFVIADRLDYEWAIGIISDQLAHRPTKILLSTVYGELPPRNLVKWILEDNIKARFQLQLHKYIWPHDSHGV
jgi:7-carboxy-7-deazaguanine synthase